MKLTESEVRMAVAVGVQRHIESLKKGLPDKHGHSGPGWDLHIEGACGELAVARFLGLYWDGSVNTFKDGGDVQQYQVRTSPQHTHRLIIREDDDPDAIFFFVTGMCPRYKIRGWIRGRDAMRDKWLDDPHGREAAYFVPAKALNRNREWQD
jgi:hypothetical protein